MKKENMKTQSLLIVVLIWGTSTANYEAEMAAIKLLFYSPDVTVPVNIKEMANISEYLDAGKKLKVLIHGWNANSNHIAMQPVKDAYLKKNNENVISVDWADIAALPYDVARFLVASVANVTCGLMHKVINHLEMNLDDVHLIGHSLGAHLAGNVGNCFKGQLGRITALDSAGPLFTQLSRDAIKKQNAKFVDSIHTAASTLGEPFRRGHANFYPNLGTNPQPGCVTLDIVTLSSCSHYRAPLFFAESIMMPESFPSYICEAIFDILPTAASCLLKGRKKGKSEVFMGEYVDQSSMGVFYLETNNVFPFGKGICSN